MSRHFLTIIFLYIVVNFVISDTIIPNPNFIPFLSGLPQFTSLPPLNPIIPKFNSFDDSYRPLPYSYNNLLPPYWMRPNLIKPLPPPVVPTYSYYTPWSGVPSIGSGGGGGGGASTDDQIVVAGPLQEKVIGTADNLESLLDKLKAEAPNSQWTIIEASNYKPFEHKNTHYDQFMPTYLSDTQFALPTTPSWLKFPDFLDSPDFLSDITANNINKTDARKSDVETRIDNENVDDAVQPRMDENEKNVDEDVKPRMDADKTKVDEDVKPRIDESKDDQVNERIDASEADDAVKPRLDDAEKKAEADDEIKPRIDDVAEKADKVDDEKKVEDVDAEIKPRIDDVEKKADADADDDVKPRIDSTDRSVGGRRMDTAKADDSAKETR